MSEASPPGWIKTPLGEWIPAIEAGASFRCDERPPEEGETGVAKVSAVTWGEYDEAESKTVRSRERIDERLLVRPGDFLFSRANTIELVGACVIARQVTRRVMLSDKILRFRIAGLLPLWVLYFLRSRDGRAEIERLATGNQESMRNIGQERIKAIEIPVAPLAEQRRIVAALEEHLSELDAAVAGLERARANCTNLRAAVLCAVVDGSLIKSVQRRGVAPSPDAWTPSVPVDWSWTTVEELADLVEYGTSAKTGSGEDGVPVLRMGNIVDGALSWERLKFLPRAHEEFPRLLLQDGDLLFNRTNSPELVGKSAVFRSRGREASFASYLLRVRMREDMSPEFLAAYLNSRYGRAWVASVVSQQVGQANVNGSKLRSLQIPVPPRETQDALVAALARALDGLDRTTFEIGQQLLRATRLRQSILKHAFEGKLVPQDPNDEPASVLLDRVRAERQASTQPSTSRQKKSTPTPRRSHKR